MYCMKQPKKEELRERIYSCHLAYLNLEESPGKLEKFQELECLIEEFLMMATHSEKFSFSSIADVLTHSVNSVHDFSAHKAGTAFRAVEKYATNLLAHPWRKEYRIVKMYGGFYKHTIECHLPMAHALFVAMGYRQNGLELILEEPLDPDLVARVALDCLVAYVECQVMIGICESMSLCKVGWREIHNVRLNYVCNLDEAVRLLSQMKRAQKMDILTYDPPPPMNHHVHPVQQQTLWPSNDSRHLLVDLSNNCDNHFQDDLLLKHDDLLTPLTTGRTKLHLEGLSVSRTRSPSWTEGLSSTDHPRKPKMSATKWESEGSDPYQVYTNGQNSLNRTNKWTAPSDVFYRLPAFVDDSWDFIDGAAMPPPAMYGSPNRGVPVLLMGRHHSLPRPMDPTEGILIPRKPLPPPYPYSPLPAFPKELPEPWTLINYEEQPKLPKRVQADGPSSRHEVSVAPPRHEIYPEASLTTSRHSKSNSIPKRNSFYDNVPIENGFSKPLEETAKNCSALPRIAAPPPPAKSLGKPSAPKPVASSLVINKSMAPPPCITASVPVNLIGNEKVANCETNVDLDSGPWNCTSCTFLNGTGKGICEMCGRSRFPVEEESPLVSGGRQCPQCTLVNQRGNSVCSACETSLQDSSTYI